MDPTSLLLFATDTFGVHPCRFTVGRPNGPSGPRIDFGMIQLTASRGAASRLPSAGVRPGRASQQLDPRISSVSTKCWALVVTQRPGEQLPCRCGLCGSATGNCRGGRGVLGRSRPGRFPLGIAAPDRRERFRPLHRPASRVRDTGSDPGTVGTGRGAYSGTVRRAGGAHRRGDDLRTRIHRRCPRPAADDRSGAPPRDQVVQPSPGPATPADDRDEPLAGSQCPCTTEA